MVKEGIRILGLDDGYLGKRVLIVGVIYKITGRIDGAISFYVKRDGRDATSAIINAVLGSRFGKTINVIMTNGISFGGFNIFDINEIYEKTGKPVIVIISKKPNFKKIKEALRRFEDFEERWELIKKAGKVYRMKIRSSYIYYQVSGIDKEEAKRIIEKCCKESKIPEPIRIAHIIASGISLGESTKKI